MKINVNSVLKQYLFVNGSLQEDLFGDSESTVVRILVSLSLWAVCRAQLGLAGRSLMQ